ncbi:MAG: hypothetical protein ACKO14_14095 [Armatimonadota bacterium]
MLASVLIPLVVIASIWIARVAWMWAADFDKNGKQRISLGLRLGALVLCTWWMLPIGAVIFKLFILREDP